MDVVVVDVIVAAQFKGSFLSIRGGKNEQNKTKLLIKKSQQSKQKKKKNIL